MKKHLVGLGIFILALAMMPADAQNQAGPPSQPPAQPPDQPAELQPGAARVSFIHGDVSSQRGDTGDWTAVTLNTPIVPGDRVSTGQKSRAELQLDWADILRMSDGATAKVAVLDRTHIQLQVGQGLVTYNVLKGTEADSEIDTPNSAIHPLEPGEYRILVNSDAETQVIIRKGSAEVSEPQGSTRVEQGRMITVAGTDNPQYKIDNAPGKDDWDAWNNERDHQISSAESWRKTNHYYVGSEDLDAYGQWTEIPDYGPVWVPTVEVGWAPYRVGRWCWEPYFGWTWVSYEPWGWAPYHYGRWFVYGGNWVWWPGPVYAYPGYYPLWAPAYVSFFGWGGGGWGFSFGFGFGWGGWGRIGWLPCGPGEWYHPWYGRWGGRFNVMNVTNIHNTFINEGIRPLAGAGMHPYSNMQSAFSDARVRSGMSSMAGNEFGRGAVSAHQEAVSEASFRQASMMTGKMPVSPSRESYSPSGRSANASAIRNAPPASQHFFSPASRSTSPANAAGARTFAGTNEAGRSESAFSAGRNATSPVQSSRPGWRTFTPPQSGSSTSQGQGRGAEARSETNSFGRGTFSAPSGQASQTAGARTENANGWQHFTGPSRASQSEGFVHSNTPSTTPQRAFNPPTTGSRGSYGTSTARPPLNMRQPIVTPRGGSYGYSQPRGGSAAPRGGYSAPRGYSGGGGGSRGGTGHSSGGGRSGGGRSR